MSNICVLMSSYNGGQYIREQINSILSQDNVNLTLVVRDDGSTDNTLDILKAYQNEGKLTYFQGSNLGPARSFLQLLKDAPKSDFYAFSDQDDYWLPDKLYSAIQLLNNERHSPALYFCQTQLADKDLNMIPSVIIHPLLTFGESLISEFIGGCTMVLNHSLRQIVIAYEPRYLMMHDTWIYSIALAVNSKVVFDSVPHMLYRQHGNNVVGQGAGKLVGIKRRYKRIRKKEQSRYRRAKELKAGFEGYIPSDNMDILNMYISGKKSFKDRLKLITDKRFRCANKKTKRLFNLAVMLNLY